MLSCIVLVDIDSHASQSRQNLKLLQCKLSTKDVEEANVCFISVGPSNFVRKGKNRSNFIGKRSYFLSLYQQKWQPDLRAAKVSLHHTNIPRR